MKIIRLSDLILEIEKIEEIKRIRYTTSHPRDMTDDLIEVYDVFKKINAISSFTCAKWFR